MIYTGRISTRSRLSIGWGIANGVVSGIIRTNNTRHASQRCAPDGLLFCGVVKA